MQYSQKPTRKYVQKENAIENVPNFNFSDYIPFAQQVHY